jgi:hypothetical protein
MKSEKRKKTKPIPVSIRVQVLIGYAAKVFQSLAEHQKQADQKQRPKSQSKAGGLSVFQLAFVEDFQLLIEWHQVFL